MVTPKILVGCPTSDHKEYCIEPYIHRLVHLTYPTYDILIVDNSENDSYVQRIKETLKKFTKHRNITWDVVKDDHLPHVKDRIVHSRNLIREKALKEGYDYFFSLEQDVIPPPDVIERLLSHDKKVITGIYFKEAAMLNTTTRRKEIVPLPIIYKDVEHKEELAYIDLDELENNKLLKIVGCGVGCLLIAKDVLKKITFRYDKRFPAFDDMYFCSDLEQQHIPLYADTTIICRHLHKQTDWEKIT